MVGSTMPIERLKRMQQMFPDAKLLPMYGMTEAAGFIALINATYSPETASCAF